jgi:hypothetical protein
LSFEWLKSIWFFPLCARAKYRCQNLPLWTNNRISPKSLTLNASCLELETLVAIKIHQSRWGQILVCSSCSKEDFHSLDKKWSRVSRKMFPHSHRRDLSLRGKNKIPDTKQNAYWKTNVQVAQQSSCLYKLLFLDF